MNARTHLSRLVDSALQGEPFIIAEAGKPLVRVDPFDRMLLAQAVTEGVTLLTADQKVAAYPGPATLV